MPVPLPSFHLNTSMVRACDVHLPHILGSTFFTVEPMPGAAILGSYLSLSERKKNALLVQIFNCVQRGNYLSEREESNTTVLLCFGIKGKKASTSRSFLSKLQTKRLGCLLR